MKTRFAPSPTGYMHLGNVRTALICWLYMRKVGGKFLLRIDDTDTERSEEQYVEAVKEDLIWLGLDWDDFTRQSERMGAYDAAVEKLKASGRLYACYETQEELEFKRKMQLGRGKPPIYDREALRMSDEQKAKFEEEGRKPHYRFKLDEGNIEWDDEIRGHVHFEGKHLSDPILVRENGLYTYMLPSTVDDIDLEISHVLRGEDHVSNTAIQIQLFQALEGKVPIFAHNALIHTQGGKGKLSKREGKSSLRILREDGLEPMAINSFLAKVGTSDPIEIRASLDELVAEFDIKKFSRASTTYAIDDIHRLNEKLLHQLSFEDVKEKVDVPIDEVFWQAVRPNISALSEIKDWWIICKENVSPAIDDSDFTREAAAQLPEGDWNQETWQIWTNAVKEKTGRKGKELFMPLRKALTGLDHGPELKVLLPLIGRDKALARLNGEVA